MRPQQIYEIAVIRPGELGSEELSRCISLISNGGAVNERTMRRDLPQAQVLVTATQANQIVGVGAIKSVRVDYSRNIAIRCGYDFSPDTPELGYISIDPEHRGQRLSHRITSRLLSKYTGPLFATTDDHRMKRSLASAGFRMQGKEWQGARGTLSYWERL